MNTYQEKQIEDVAKLLRKVWEPKYYESQGTVDSVLESLVEDFADLFAADNPPTCGQCGRPKGTDKLRPADEPLVEHQFSSGGGFDRERFLAACGLEETS